MPINIERGHAMESAIPSSRGHQRSEGASPALVSRQVHKKLLPGLLAESASQRRPQQQHKRRCSCSSAAKSQPLLRATTTRHVWLLSIMSLIFIAMLARGCHARAFLGNEANGGAPNTDSGTYIQQVAGSGGDRFYAPDGLSRDLVLEASCRNLIESLLYPRIASREARNVIDVLDYADVVKRASPKHTPRFGRR